MVHFETRECQRPACGLRFPVVSGSGLGEVCPLCEGPTAVVAKHAAGRERRPAQNAARHRTLEGFLDNVRSAYNVGAIFRTADGAGVSHLHLGGITPGPDHPRVAKTALGAERAVPWTAHRNGLVAARKLRANGRALWALEAGPGGDSLFARLPEGGPQEIVLVVGNELAGVDPDILAICDRHVALPMKGHKRSLNVEVAFGVAAYVILHDLGQGAGELAA